MVNGYILLIVNNAFSIIVNISTDTRFPITISTANPDLSPDGSNQVKITLLRTNGTLLDVQTLSIQTSKYACN